MSADDGHYTPASSRERRDLEDLFGALLDTGHSVHEAARFLVQLVDGAFGAEEVTP